ncbi:15166_t:CDS:2, partial [Acaulospora colombiana]
QISSQAMPKTLVPIGDISVGDTVWVPLIIEIEDYQNFAGGSTTSKRVRKGQSVDRLAVVLVADGSSIQVTYSVTFGGQKSLPASVTDKTMWYPVSPASNEGNYDPLPMVPDQPAHWICVRKKQTITSAM